MASKKIQLPAIGGIRKVVKVGDDVAANPGTTIAEFSNQTVTLDQLAAAIAVRLGLKPQAAQPSTGGVTGSLVLGPGFAGGGPLVGAVPLYLTAPIPAMMGDDGGGGGDGEPGPPGQAGANGATGAGGPAGPAVFMSADDGEDGWHAVPGPQGPQGNPGSSGINGAAIFMAADPGEDGIDAIPGPQGPVGANGANGANGRDGVAVYMLGEDGADGEPGPPGASASSISLTGIPRFVGEAVAGSATDNITISGLDIDTDDCYFIQLDLIGGTNTSTANLRVFFNGDTTDGNYERGVSTDGGTTVTGDNAVFGGAPQNAPIRYDVWVTRNPSGRVIASFFGSRINATALNLQLSSVIWDTSANLTSLTINSDISGQLATGSRIRVWKFPAH